MSNPFTPLFTREQLRAWASWNRPEWRSFIRAWLRRGFRWPPGGSEHDDPEDGRSARAQLWEIADARPNDLARWVAEPPRGASPWAVLRHIFDRWAAVRDGFRESDDEMAQEERLAERRSARESDRKALETIAQVVRNGA